MNGLSRLVCAATCGAVCLGSPFALRAAAQPATLVKDLVPGPFPTASSPHSMRRVGAHVYFAANTPEPESLWRTDGTPAGTVLIKATGANIFTVTDAGGTVFFVASDDIHGAELWKTDGTENGTVLVADIVPGPGAADIQPLGALGTTFFFRVSDATAGEELWKSDGTAAGTVLVKDIRPGPAGSSPQSGMASGGRFFFTADDGGAGQELWKSDGTEAGTTRVKDIYPGPDGSNPARLFDFQGALLFTAIGASVGEELWKSDGTEAGTVLVADIATGPAGSNAYGFVDAAGTVYFSAYGAAGSALFKTDGTTAGTLMVRALFPGYPSSLVAAGAAVFFEMDGSLWKSDGSSAGTNYVEGVYLSAGSWLAAMGGVAYFVLPGVWAEQGAVWRSDGTAPGTFEVKYFAGRYLGPRPTELVALGSRLLFAADDGGAQARELWQTDGTTVGTTLLANLAADNASSAPHHLANLGGELFLVAHDPTGYEPRLDLWRSDGTPAGSTVASGGVKDRPIVGIADEQGVFVRSTEQLWGWDGALAHEITPFGFTYEIRDIAPLAGRAFFNANGEVWQTDGTSFGKVLAVEGDFLGYGELRAVDGQLFVAAGLASTPGVTLCRTDGTAEGLVSLGAQSVDFATLTAAAGVVFFVASDAEHGTELWKTDGTLEGTTLVQDIVPGANGSNPRSLTSVAGRLFFEACTDAAGCELWKSDGTDAGTTLVRDLVPGALGSLPRNFTRVGELLFLSAADELAGRELWKSDGTEVGTVRVKDIAPGARSGIGVENRRWLDLGSELLFPAWTEAAGEELWRSDGTEAGTALVQDIRPGPSSSRPSEFAVAGARAYFQAEDGLTGRELWAMPVPAFSITDESIGEGHSGAGTLTFTVTLLNPDGRTATVGYATEDGTGAAGVDYLPVSGGLEFPAGVTSRTVVVSVLGDGLDEDDETFFLRLADPVHAALGDALGRGRILDDDPRPLVSINDVAVTEGQAGTSVAVFTVRISRGSGRRIDVGYTAVEGTAEEGLDFVAAAGTVSFDPGETAATLAVTVAGDAIYERNETFYVNLSAGASAGLGDGQGRATLLNDDPAPVVTINDVSVAEGDGGITYAVFTVNASGPTALPVTLEWQVAAGTADAGDDYTPASGTLALGLSQWWHTVAVTVAGDLDVEPDETFFVQLANVVDATLGRSQGTGTIVNDDGDLIFRAGFEEGP